MLIRKEHTDEGGLLAIWEMEESREELLSRFPEHLRAEAIEYINSVRSERRSIEWLSTRAMVFILLGKDKSVQITPMVNHTLQTIATTSAYHILEDMLHFTYTLHDL